MVKTYSENKIKPDPRLTLQSYDGIFLLQASEVQRWEERYTHFKCKLGKIGRTTAPVALVMICSQAGSSIAKNIHAVRIDGELGQIPVASCHLALEALRTINGRVEDRELVVRQPVLADIDVLPDPGFFVAALCRRHFRETLAQEI
jgi:hypothetical protein